MSRAASRVTAAVRPSTLSVAERVGGAWRTVDPSAFAVRRIYCVGRNYHEHAVEMAGRHAALVLGEAGDVERKAPFFFQKPSFGAVVDTAVHDQVRYPVKTALLEFEAELVVALQSGGANLKDDEAAACVFALGVGVDLTRRDLQNAAKLDRRPWDAAKAFDDSAPCSALGVLNQGGLVDGATSIALAVDGVERQRATLDQMIYGVHETIQRLSTEVTLCAGDLIFTGTPAGVGPVLRGQRVVAEVRDASGNLALPACAFTVV